MRHQKRIPAATAPEHPQTAQGEPALGRLPLVAAVASGFEGGSFGCQLQPLVEPQPSQT
jgi:hypothetical protein